MDPATQKWPRLHNPLQFASARPTVAPNRPEGQGRFTPPPNANELYGSQDVETIFTETALMILGEMAERKMPLSRNLRLILDPDYSTSDSESDLEPELAEGQWRALRLTGKRKHDGTAFLYEVKWQGRWRNTFEPPSCLEGWEDEMADVDQMNAL